MIKYSFISIVVCVCVCVGDLFDELPPAVYRWPASLPRTCRQPWPLYTSAGIFLYVIPGGKLQLLVLLTQSDNGKMTSC